MLLDPILNFAKGDVSIGYDDTATSIVLSSGDGANFPSLFSYNVVWWNFTDFPDPSDDPNVEIVRVTNRSTDTLTVTRAQEGIAATTKNTGGKTYKMILAFTKKTYDDMAVLGNGNLVINGDMRIAERGISFAALTTSQYTLDRMEWIDTGITVAVVTVTKDTDVPTVAEAGFKFENSLKIDVTTAETLASGDAALYLSHKIEAQNVTFFGHGALGALSATLSFWFKSTKTGIFTVNVDRDDATEKYSTEFTVGTTNTWEKHTITIPGDVNGSAITDDNGIGLALQFMMAVGSTGTTSTSDAWNASGTTELATANQVNLLDNTANNVLITGIQYNQGSTASDFKTRDIGIESIMCKRYFERLNAEGAASMDYAILSSNSTTVARGGLYWNVSKRTGSPSLSLSGVTDFILTTGAGAVRDTTNITLTAGNSRSVKVTATIGTTDLTAGASTRFVDENTGNSFIDIDAEL